MENTSPLRKTLIFSILLSAFSSSCAAYIQLSANKRVSSCSYLDPITVDIAACIGGCFLVIESLVDIIKHRDSLLRHQLTRYCRMAFGSAVIAIHIIQFIHK